MPPGAFVSRAAVPVSQIAIFQGGGPPETAQRKSGPPGCCGNPWLVVLVVPWPQNASEGLRLGPKIIP